MAQHMEDRGHRGMIELTSGSVQLPVPTNIAHRGASGSYPENTVIAFKKGIEYGADAIELDVWHSQDDEVVVIHDETLERTTNGMGKVTEHSLEVLRKLDAGYNFTTKEGFPFRGQGITIPTLREILAHFKETPIIIEVKQEGYHMAKLVAKTIEKEGAVDRVIIASSDRKTIYYIRELLPAASSASIHEVSLFYILSKLRLAKLLPIRYDALIIPLRYRGIPVLTRPVLSALRTIGTPTFVWTINDQKVMHKLIRVGVHGIITDYPALLKEVVDQYKYSVGHVE